jgi:lysophospholipase L1-like esterase
LAAAATGIALSLLCAELVVRQVYYIPWELDPEFGCIVLPGTTARYRLEGNGVSHWTLHGVRALRPPDPSLSSVLVLGDSFTEAYMVDDADSFPVRLERDLTARTIPLSVINAGRSAASPADYTADADRNRRYFNPRWVVIQLNEDDLTGDAWSPDKAHFVVQGDRLVAEPGAPRTQSALGRSVWRMRQSSALLHYGIIRVQEFADATRHAPPLFFATEHVTASATRAFDDAAIAAELEAMVTAYGGHVTFMLLPTFDPLHAGVVDSVEMAFASACRQNTWSCVNLRAGYTWFAVRHLSPFGFANSSFNVGHMNVLGHRLAARLLAKELRRLWVHALL